MHGIYKLKDKIIEELEEFGNKPELKGSELPTIDTLAHAAKNLCKLIQMCEDETGYSYGSGRYSRYNDYGNSYRGRTRMYDDMGGYSNSNDWMVDTLHELKDKAPNDQMRREFDEFIKRMERSR